MFNKDGLPRVFSTHEVEARYWKGVVADMEKKAALQLLTKDGCPMFRSEVVAMAVLMELKLRENENKAGWKDCEAAWLHERLLDEARELLDAPNDKKPLEAADVCNFAMMEADVSYPGGVVGLAGGAVSKLMEGNDG